MFIRIPTFAIALILMATAAQARRVALVIGQNAYYGGASPTIGLPPLENPKNDAKRLAAILKKHEFELIGCGGSDLGCHDLTRADLVAALAKLEDRAKGADLALVFFAGHGMATEEGIFSLP